MAGPLGLAAAVGVGLATGYGFGMARPAAAVRFFISSSLLSKALQKS